MSAGPPPDQGGRTPEEREAARREREARRAAREGRPPPPAPEPPSFEREEPPSFAREEPPSVAREEPPSVAREEPPSFAREDRPEPSVPEPPRTEPPEPAWEDTAAHEPPPEAFDEPAADERTAVRPARAAAPPVAGGRRDWLADAQRLTGRGYAEDGAGRGRFGGRGGRGAGGRGPGAPGGDFDTFSHDGRRRHRPGRVIALVVFAAVVLAIAWFANSLFQPFKGDGGERVRVTIPQGYTLSQIADRLEQAGVVDDAGFFQLRARLDGESSALRPGSYELRKSMSFTAAIDALKQGVPPDVVQISIPEGLSRREVRPLTEGLPGNYVRATRSSPKLDPRDYGGKGATSLEGFLFPATYELKKGRRVNRLVEEQLASFKRNFDKVDLSYAKRKNLTAYDVLTIASLIEREAMVAKERPLIASVIYNRLRDGIPLGIDATVRFVTGNWRRPLRQSELDNPSPYNTRKVAGLPPGPIGSPGLASIRAAARPARSDYLFYVVKVDSCGAHKFAETDAEFQAYVNEYNRAREARGGKSPTKPPEEC